MSASSVPLPPSPAPTSSNPIPGSNRLYDIPSLENDAANFQTWKFRITTVLDIRGLLSIVDGTHQCPAASNAKEHARWQKLDKEARAQICLMLKDEPLNGVLHVATRKKHGTNFVNTMKEKGSKCKPTLLANCSEAHFQMNHHSSHS